MEKKLKADLYDFGHHVNQSYSALALWSKYYRDIEYVALKNLGKDSPKNIVVRKTGGIKTISYCMQLIKSFLTGRTVIFITGPEYGNRLNRAVVELCTIALNLLGLKFILYIKNPLSYVNTQIGKIFVRRAMFICFESETIKEYAISLREFSGVCCIVSYVYYRYASIMPYLPVEGKINRSGKMDSTGRIKIGFLGRIDANTRDLELLAKILANSQINSKVDFIPLSSWNDLNLDKPIKDYFKDYKNSYISTAEYYYLAGRCDYFISLNKLEHGYGRSKGSGAFGDAYSFNKKLICPKWLDPDGEFQGFSFTYKDYQELVDILIELPLPALSEEILNDPFLAKVNKEVKDLLS